MTMVSTTSSHTGVGKVANEVSGHLDVDVVPGTEILTDFHSTALAHTDGKNVVLVPQPQNNVHDPLVSILPVILIILIGVELEPTMEVHHLGQYRTLHVPDQLHYTIHLAHDTRPAEGVRH